jgi:predicted nucleotidyltransferase
VVVKHDQTCPIIRLISPDPLARDRSGTPLIGTRPGTDPHSVMDSSVLDTIIERIVEVADPERIFLFGSAAREEMGPHSDFDVLVVKEEGNFSRGRLVEEIYMNLIGVEAAVDVIVVHPEEVEKYRDSHSLIISPALEEGREVYHAE